MFSQVMAVFSVIKELIKFIKMMMDFVEKKRLRDIEERRQSLILAQQDLQKAKTDEEIFKAQSDIVKHSLK
jgi:hypothetical protein